MAEARLPAMQPQRTRIVAVERLVARDEAPVAPPGPQRAQGALPRTAAFSSNAHNKLRCQQKRGASHQTPPGPYRAQGALPRTAAFGNNALNEPRCQPKTWCIAPSAARPV